MADENGVVRAYCQRRHTDVVFNPSKLDYFPCGLAERENEGIQCLRDENNPIPCTAYASFRIQLESSFN